MCRDIPGFVFCVMNAGPTDGLRVAAQHVVVLIPLLLNTTLHGAEHAVHPLSEALLDLPVVLLHLQFERLLVLM